MSFDSPSRFPAREQVLVRGASDVERRFMAAVYRWMTLGLGVTALVATAVASSETLLLAIVGNRILFYGLVIAELALVIWISAAVNRLPAAAAGGLFLLYSALNGATLSVVLLVYTGASVGIAFLTTAGTFAAMSVYGTVTRRDLTGWGSFLFMGLIGIVIASLANLFFRSDMVSWVVSCMGVLVFTGLTAYDTQKLRAYARAGGGAAAAPVSGALSLYLDFVNLFLSLLRLFGNRR
ncbi:Bax inhibitor-1/YccA family protein [Anaeromyxobacter sp. PSR-1]|uniref:Bax inhibitor-1/YccA family protein n=1 Tax=Anaeromyxobacter sp. PSR-1 TaxID=1300915 RepID=UPI0005DBA45E|nr:Bax inhibitor-1/YccA family protein [Anaeromyxobacter sp. PSR-1]GAO03029.1 inner membrane protein YbhL [Anaeromyxobacter sp. PSR-1]